MKHPLAVTLPPDLQEFVDRNSGEGTPHATAAEFVQHVLLEKKERVEALEIRDAVLEGYDDAIRGRTVPYQGDLRLLLKSTGKREG